MANSQGFQSTTYANGTPKHVGVVGVSETLVADVLGGLSGTLTLPGFAQYGAAMPASCIVDSICLTVGSPAFTAPPARTIYAFAMLATADGDEQTYALHPETKAEVTFEEGVSVLTGIKTIRETALSFVLEEGKRFIVVCGHYTAGGVGASKYIFSYSGTILFK